MISFLTTFTVLILAEAETFILSLPEKMQAKIFKTIGLLREFGYNLPEPHSKKLQGTKNIKELRVKSVSDICRLFYFHFQGNTYVITSGYVKKETKTKRSEIEKAENLMRRVMEAIT